MRAAGLQQQVVGQRPLPDEIRRLPSSAEIFKTYSELRQDRKDVKSDPAAAKRLLGALRTQLAPYYLDQVAARYRVAVAAEESFRERLVHFWSNHFAVSADKPQVLALAGTLENEAIRPHLSGRFADLLAAVEAHPAMILYLDNQASIGPGSQLAQRRGRRAAASDRKLGINENLAREILELHTLGVDGGYTQQDVTTFAQALTGWFARHGSAVRGRRAGQVRISRCRARAGRQDDPRHPLRAVGHCAAACCAGRSRATSCDCATHCAEARAALHCRRAAG
jgi:uncharacterized protein (DUF1800 family)